MLASRAVQEALSCIVYHNELLFICTCIAVLYVGGQNILWLAVGRIFAWLAVDVAFVLDSGVLGLIAEAFDRVSACCSSRQDRLGRLFGYPADMS